MPKVAIIAKLTAVEGRRADLVAALHAGVDNARTEPGTEMYIVHEDAADENVVWFYEMYTDHDALAAHSGSDAMKSFGRSVAPFLAGRPIITVLNPVVGKGL